ncbi:MAG: hypothetical protein LUG51_11515 [Tannerellaceae bacterium]|nr:hypothetical protein [Tannerellaceae bacterium]
MRVNGSLGVEWIECIHPVKNRWAVRWDVQPETDENGEKIGVTYEEEVFNHRPTEPEIKEKVNAWINASVDEKIFSGFVWEGYPVWLSQENQFNYKAAYDLAVQTSGATLPVKFKLGTDEEPKYHLFETVEELSDFYIKLVAHIQNTLGEGWEKKENFDYSLYQ